MRLLIESSLEQSSLDVWVAIESFEHQMEFRIIQAVFIFPHGFERLDRQFSVKRDFRELLFFDETLGDVLEFIFLIGILTFLNLETVKASWVQSYRLDRAGLHLLFLFLRWVVGLFLHWFVAWVYTIPLFNKLEAPVLVNAFGLFFFLVNELIFHLWWIFRILGWIIF